MWNIKSYNFQSIGLKKPGGVYDEVSDLMFNAGHNCNICVLLSRDIMVAQYVF